MSDGTRTRIDHRRAERRGRSLAWLLPLAALQALTACASGSMLERVEVDRSIVTGANPVAEAGLAAIADTGKISDAVTIRNAATSADPREAERVPWINESTGSAGFVTAIAAFDRSGARCRRFSATRESFDGVAMFSGEACMEPSGAWRMTRFEAL